MEISGFLVAFLSQDSDMARTSRLAECAKAVNVNVHKTKVLTVTEVKK